MKPNESSIRLDHLAPEQFEELCFDLLADLGFLEISWRKGTGGPGSPSDGGRDIEATLQRAVPDGSTLRERWFIECKHHAAGVPSTALEPLLTAAVANRPDHVLFVCSGFLSNPAKDFLERYVALNNPPFRVSTWERPKLHELLGARSRLLVKYALASDLLFLDQLHPLHAYFIRDFTTNSEALLWEILDALPAVDRDKCLNMAYHMVIHPKFRRSRNEHETLAELMVDRVDYPTFKERCAECGLSGPFLVRAIVSFSLDCLFCFADQTRTDFVAGNWRSFIEHLTREMEGEETDEARQQQLAGMIGRAKESVDGLPAGIREGRRLYEFFCESVIAPLLLEPWKMAAGGDALNWVE